mgnify:CR=1 FL=1
MGLPISKKTDIIYSKMIKRKGEWMTKAIIY